MSQRLVVIGKGCFRMRPSAGNILFNSPVAAADPVRICKIAQKKQKSGAEKLACRKQAKYDL